MKVSVIGCGAWGTAAAILLGNYSREDVCLWVRPEEEFKEQSLFELIGENSVNEKYLPGFVIPNSVEVTNSLESAVSGSDMIISAVPSKFLRATARDYRDFANKEQIVVSLTKGVEYDDEEKRFKRMSEVLEETLKIPYDNIVVLSGPNFAKEIAAEYPTATVVAGLSQERVNKVLALFNRPPILRVYKPKKESDIVGVELGGALKNPYAIAGGICKYLFEQRLIGENSKAAFKTRCLEEMIRFAETFGADRYTLTGLSGFGDLDLCFDSLKSRNCMFGYNFSQNYDIKSVEREIKGVVEGVRTLKHVYRYAESKGLDMNIIRQIYLVVYEKKPIRLAINDLMTGSSEVE